jgi:class 3 adenylate cyclase/tetratricopeptide (TPR) repeat protein
VAICANCGHENPEGARFCNACAAPLGTASPGTREQRKTVTVLFCDVTGSTALGERLDPESLRRVLARYFETAKAVVERHGGTVEKFIGDAVMAVFGVPQVHEDDALRAVRAAAQLRDALEPLNAELERDYGTTLSVRIGINTGEVVTGTEERLATGDAVNVAARLEQAAQPSEILLGPETLSLVRGSVTVEPVTPLELKGKAEPLAAFRLVSLDDEAPTRRHGVAMVGRDRQLRMLRGAFENVASERACSLFTVLGPAGVGKSRLVFEFLQSVEDATIVRGRCLSYGEGITYWPVVEVVKALGDHAERVDDVARAALDGLLGQVDSGATPGELAWAFRRLLEAHAAEQPVVCLFDDIQWGEETFLDLVEHVADLSRGAPILVLCMARPELLDRRPTWGGGMLNAANVLLEPLSEDETDELIERLLEGAPADEKLQARIRRGAAGNPLFVEEMVELVTHATDGDVTIPPTIQALLAARLDQLDPSERVVLEHGSVEGELFHRGAVAALGEADSQVDSRLVALVRKDLVRPERPQLAGEDGYRFRHLLIRDAAYEALPKATRADLHARFAVWLEGKGSELVELDEIVGYHLEQSFLYRSELGPLRDDDRRIAERAGELLGRAGRRALDRGDRTAAAILLRRATDLLPEPDAQHVLTLLDLGRCLLETADDLRGSRTAFERASQEAAALGRDDLELRTQLELQYLGTYIDDDVQAEKSEALALQAIDVLARDSDDEGLARAWFLLAISRWTAGRWDEMVEPLENSAEHARRARHRSMEREPVMYLNAALMFGLTPVADGIRRGYELLETVSDSRDLQGWTLRTIGTLRGLEGQFDEARELLEQARAIFKEHGNKISLAALAFSTGPLEVRAGDPVAAERELRAALDIVEELGDRGRIPNLGSILVDALLEQGRLDEAEHWAHVASDAVQTGDVSGDAFTRMAVARVLARRGKTVEAVELARESVALMADTQEILTRPWLLTREAEVLELAGLADEAAAALRESIELWELKGATAEVRLAQQRSAALEART